MSVLRGDTFEKAGVNISTVFGSISTNLKERFLVLIITINSGLQAFRS